MPLDRLRVPKMAAMDALVMPETGTPDLSALLRKALADDPEVKEIFKQLYPAMSQQFETTAMFLVATLGWATRARLAELADKRAKAERQVWGGGAVAFTHRVLKPDDTLGEPYAAAGQRMHAPPMATCTGGREVREVHGMRLVVFLI